jgi:predicted DNA-binding transcriptional regulator YafY
MTGHQVYERYLWFDQQMKRGAYPNASTLARQFDIDPKTAQRTVARMRDYLRAPIQYEPSRRGYFYSKDSFSLPQLPISQNELMALLLSRQLLLDSAGGVISREIDALVGKLKALVGERGFDFERLDAGFSAQWPGFSPADGGVFQCLATALLQYRTLEFDYYSPQRNRQGWSLIKRG